MRRIACTILACSLVTGCADGPAATKPAVARWITTVEGCRVWDPVPRDGEVANWSGPCVDGTGEGHGTLTWRLPRPSAGLALQSEFTGEMRRGFLDGPGRLDSYRAGGGAPAVTVTGTFKQGRLDGPGVARTADGLRYAGNFHDGHRDGHGMLTWGRGNAFEGEFRGGRPNGPGRLVAPAAGTTANPRLVLDGTWQDGCYVSGWPFVCLSDIP